MKTNLFIWLMLLPFLGLAISEDTPFHQGGFIAAKKQAKTEGKLQLLEFVADWCLPCKHMDQTTFKDPTVVQYLNDNFISVKVDIDQFDGFALKQEFAVKYLPTIVLLDNEGNLIHKIEEALSATQLINDLSEISTSYYKNNPVSTSYSEKDISTNESVTPDLSGLSVKRLEIAIQKDEIKNTLEESTNAEPVTISQHLMLQFGVFGDQKNADRLYDQITSFLPSAPEIKTIERDGRSLYKIQYGPFNDMEEASDLQLTLKKEGINSLIKKLE